jgi:hypothetical protein
MRSSEATLLTRWFRQLGLPRQTPPSWYKDRLREELRERHNATTSWQKLSESSDVYFCLSRARYDGFPIKRLPGFAPSRHAPVYAYMLCKYTSRWGFYRVVAMLCRSTPYKSVCEVVNPFKDVKLAEVAVRHHIDPVQFARIGRKLRRVWPLLP